MHQKKVNSETSQWLEISASWLTYISISIYIYIYLCIYIYVYRYVYIYVYTYTYNRTSCAKCMSCHKAIVVITRRVHCFYDYMYIMPILLLWDLSTLCVVDIHLYIYKVSIFIYIRHLYIYIFSYLNIKHT